MRIKDWQHQVDSWIKAYGIRYFDVKTNALLLVEETGELMRYIARVYGEQSFKNPEDASTAEERIKEELGDVLFVLTCIANQLEINLEDILSANIEKKTQRDDQRHKNNKKLSE